MSETEVRVPTIEELLAASKATDAFKEALNEMIRRGRGNDRIVFDMAGNPPVKVARAISMLLESHPNLVIDQVEVSGASGCSDYQGKLSINKGEKTFRFVWDCAWKAEQVGWKDYFGSPDQIRAARAFGYRCFQHFEEI